MHVYATGRQVRVMAWHSTAPGPANIMQISCTYTLSDVAASTSRLAGAAADQIAQRTDLTAYSKQQLLASLPSGVCRGGGEKVDTFLRGIGVIAIKVAATTGAPPPLVVTLKCPDGVIALRLAIVVARRVSAWRQHALAAPQCAGQASCPWWPPACAGP